QPGRIRAPHEIATQLVTCGQKRFKGCDMPHSTLASDAAHFAGMAATIFAYFSISLWISAPNSCGVGGAGAGPIVRKRVATSGSFKAALIAALSLATIADGVPAGATMPNQPVVSKPGTPASSNVGTSGSSP